MIFEPDELSALGSDALAFQEQVTAIKANFSADELTPDVTVIFDGRKAETWEQFQLKLTGPNGNQFDIRGDYFSRDVSKRHFKAIYSSAEINFEHQKIGSVTTQDIDRSYNSAIKSSGNLATQITQLLVDIQALDDSTVAAWVRNNLGKPPPNEMSDVRMSRFKRAFDSMFTTKKYVGVSNTSNGKEVQFTEAGRMMGINQLSSGEKQIVFRGSFLLKDRSSLKNCIALIDEPEISLHPNWQMKIVSFYRKIFEDSNKKQNAQLIFATHSPFVIHNTVDEKIIVLEKDNKSFPRIAMTPSFPGYSNSAAIEKAFNFEYIFPRLTKKTVVLVEGPSDEIILKVAWAKSRENDCPYEVVDALCASHIRVLLQRTGLYEKRPDKTFVGLLDFDSAFNEWKSLKWKELESDESKGLSTKHPNLNGVALLLPIPAHRANYASRELGGNSTLSIEFLFDDADIPSKFIGQRVVAQSTTKEKYFLDSKKIEFANLVQNWPAEKFKGFEPLLQALERLANPTTS
ncbi:MAG: hypothetical protein QOD40_1965 [Alphaproteobacteria bacterium]|jgi:energy-coupling factor transporter ATP-binding protein EcfA2|nr:hypothetical protein [Alphaproteobacteria bacterium]